MEKIGETLKRIASDTSITSNRSGGGVPPRPRAPGGPGDPDCPHCGGIGYIREDVPVGHPNFGKLFPCSCRIEEIEAAQKNRQREVSSLGPLAGKTFDNFKPEGHSTDPHQRASLQRAFEISQKYADTPYGRVDANGPAAGAT